jgi:hypothetical protein
MHAQRPVERRIVKRGEAALAITISTRRARTSELLRFTASSAISEDGSAPTIRPSGAKFASVARLRPDPQPISST